MSASGPLLLWLFGMIISQFVRVSAAQSTGQQGIAQQIQSLTEAMARTQAQVEESQRQLNEMRAQLAALQRQLATSGTNPVSSPTPVPGTAEASSAANDSMAALAAAVDEIRERQAVQEAQIATHEQAKVESESKYPVKISGLLLFNGFVNTNKVDIPATPTMALTGAGSTGASVQQTILGIDARGPHLFGAESFADLRVDFNGNPLSGLSNYFGAYSGNVTLLRLRTVHAALNWAHTQAYFSLDRPIISPDTPSSLTALAQPALAWSGNLWTWNPQIGITHDVQIGGDHLRFQAAFLDVSDAPWPVPSTTSPPPPGIPPTAAELSRWPGVEARIALLGSDRSADGNHLGVGGYFSPHRLSVGANFDAWAGTLDGQIHLPARLQWTGSFYRGQALGGLGGGAYKDYAFAADPNTGGYYFRALDDVGGWAQLKERFSSRLEANAAFGVDEIFAPQLRPYWTAGGLNYQNLARNRTYTGNIIYSPSAYLLFSLEYRRLESSPVLGPTAGSNVIGVAAGYKF